MYVTLEHMPEQNANIGKVLRNVIEKYIVWY